MDGVEEILGITTPEVKVKIESNEQKKLEVEEIESQVKENVIIDRKA